MSEWRCRFPKRRCPTPNACLTELERVLCESRTSCGVCRQEVLGMTSDEFHELPEWKQVKLKKDVDLF